MYQLDINKGDIILRGKYRNKKEVVKTFGHDEKGQPTINGKRILNFNIEKLMPQKEISETMKRSKLKILIKECIEELQEAYSPEKLANDLWKDFEKELSKNGLYLDTDRKYGLTIKDDDTGETVWWLK